jgi:hypothetical protein
MLSECLNQRDAQPPDVPGRPDLAVLQLRRVVQRGAQNPAGELAHRADGIAGQLDLIADHQQVGRFDLSLHQTIPVQEIQRAECGDEHIPCFIGTQCPTRQELGERLVGIFHNHVQINAPTQMTPTNVEDAKQVRMVEGCGRTPLDELRFGLQRIGRNQLDGGLGDALGSVFSEKNVAVVGSAEKASQGIGAVDDLVFPPDPDFGLGDSFRFCAHERRLAPKVGTKISPTGELVVYNIHTVSEWRDSAGRVGVEIPTPCGVFYQKVN